MNINIHHVYSRGYLYRGHITSTTVRLVVDRWTLASFPHFTGSPALRDVRRDVTLLLLLLDVVGQGGLCQMT